jgi:type III secretion protein W
MSDDFSTQRIAAAQADKNRIQQARQRDAALRFSVIQEAKAEEFQEWSETLNPTAIAQRRFESIETKVKRKSKEDETDKAEKKDLDVVEIEQVEEISQQFEEKNPELKAKNLLTLRVRIRKEDSSDDILRKVLEAYPDHSLADEALEFLRSTSTGELAEKLLECKEKFNETYGREIRAGKNMSIQAREFSKEGLGTPTGLRDLYREVTGNPRDPLTLFEELNAKYPFEKMKTVISFLLHSLGSDMKAKGPSIPRGELHRLVTETRSLQAILGVYRFFLSRMTLIESSFDRQGLAKNTRITFEELSKLFVKFLLERYPSAEKVLQIGIKLGISDELIAEVIIFTQMRDAVRQVAPRLYRNEQHRLDVLKGFLEAIEELDEKLEEDEEEE